MKPTNSIGILVGMNDTQDIKEQFDNELKELKRLVEKETSFWEKLNKILEDSRKPSKEDFKDMIAIPVIVESFI